jgi:glycosyltransferase involved in cell wall biosynthesis
LTSRRRNPLRAAVGRRIRTRLGIPELWARVNKLNRDVLPRLAAAERELKNYGKSRDALERELEIWRYMAWLERARPASNRLISVVTATRNHADSLERCIGSVLAQAHTQFELVVVDDGSDDATPDVLARCTDTRVRSFRIDHAGVCAARNHGLDRATGSVIAYLDDDNTMDPLWLLAVANAFDRHPEISVLYGARLIDDRLAMGGRGGGGMPHLHFRRFDSLTLKTRGLVDTNTIAHRRDHPEGRFDEDLSSYGDRDLMIRLTRDSPPYELPAIACAYSTQAVDRLSDRDRDEELARVRAKHGGADDHE